MINETDIRKVARYFDIASAYVPNQFSVFIYERSAKAQYDRKPDKHNPLYLLNLEPWVIENITFPQISFMQSDDIYVDSSSLVRPKYIKAVETSGNIEITLREKSDLAIYRSLIRCQTEMFNSRYEYDGINHFGVDYSITVRMKSQRFDNNTSEHENIFGDNVITFDRIILSNISSPKLDHASREFLRYTVTFETSSMAESYKALASGNRSVSHLKFGNPKSSLGKISNANERSTGSTQLSSRQNFNIPMPIIDSWVKSIGEDAGNNAAKGISKAMDSYGNIDTAETNNAIRSIGNDVVDDVKVQDMIDSQVNKGVTDLKNKGGVVGLGAKIVF